MSKKWRLTDRTRTLLTLELAIVLPAAALMAFSVVNLKHIQRDKAVEAAIERDFSHVLKIAGKGGKAGRRRAICLLRSLESSRAPRATHPESRPSSSTCCWNIRSLPMRSCTTRRTTWC